MNGDKLKTWQASCLLCVLLIGNLSGGYGHFKSVGLIWLSYAAAAVFGGLLAVVYAGIIETRRGRTLCDTVNALFCRPVYLTFTALFTLAAAVYCCFSLDLFTTMTGATSLRETPPLLVAMFISLIGAMLIKSGLSVAGKCSLVFLIIIAFITLFSFVFSVSEFEQSNLISLSAPSGIFSDALYFFCSSFCKTALFAGVVSNISGSAKKAVLGGVFAAAAIVICSMIRDIAVLGSFVCRDVEYPPYYAMSAVNAFDFLQRTEALGTVVTFFCAVTECAVCLYCVCIGISRLAMVRCAKCLAVPTALLLSAISCAVGYSDIISVFYGFSVVFGVFSVGSALVIFTKSKRSSAKTRRIGNSDN